VSAVQLPDRLLAERPIRRPAARLVTVPTPGILMPRRVVPMTNPWQTASRATPLLPPEALPAVPARWLQLGKVARAASRSAGPA
jgi:hypothetical protein